MCLMRCKRNHLRPRLRRVLGRPFPRVRLSALFLVKLPATLTAGVHNIR